MNFRRLQFMQSNKQQATSLRGWLNMSTLLSAIKIIFAPIKKQHGFTLVELSIVIVIIGLIISGIVAGQSLVRSAKISSITSDIDKYKTAINTFQLEYNAQPGDLPTAVSYGIASAGHFGNGDKKIDDCRYEGSYAWEHLSKAKLIPGSYTGTTGAIQQDMPKSSFSNVYYGITHIDSSLVASTGCIGLSTAVMYGVINRKSIISVGANTTFPINGFLTVNEAYGIDTKIDDGAPDKGLVYASNNGNTNVDGSRCVDKNIQGAGGANYDLNETGQYCHLMFVYYSY